MDGFVILIMTLLFSSSSLKAFSQMESYMLKRLQEKEWVLLFNNNSKNIVYTQNECFIYVNCKYDAKAEYYLSDTIETVFDKNKVGKIMNGKYIIERIISSKPVNNYPSEVMVFEIKELNANMLTLKYRNEEFNYRAKENFALKYQDPDEQVYIAGKNKMGSAFSQIGSSMLTRLQGKRWVMKETNRTFEMVFTTTKCFYYTDGKADDTRNYYLSDTIETVFDKSKVGKIMNGKYIIEGDILNKSTGNQRPFVRVHEIKEFNETTLVLIFRHDGVKYTR